MNIIDAHIHFTDAPHFHQNALLADHKNNHNHLEKAMKKENIVFAIAMGVTGREESRFSGEAMGIDLAGELDLDHYNQPAQICYCCGIHSEAITRQMLRESLDSVEKHLKTKQCVGIKFYPGYNHVYLADERHEPYFELAQYYDVPVVVHTGDTARADALVKYSHPLTVDEAAVRHPHVHFVMAHYGNPWVVDASEVAKKNENVFLDLSGLAQGNFELNWFMDTFGGYVQHLRTWLAYLNSYEKVMYGSDWPLVNLNAYIKLMQEIVPETYHDAVFYNNAQAVFPKIKPLIAQIKNV